MVFLALPNGLSMEIAPEALKAGKRVVEGLPLEAPEEAREEREPPRVVPKVKPGGALGGA